MLPIPMRLSMTALLVAVLHCGAHAEQTPTATQERLAEAVAGDHRSAHDRERDAFRHPVETLQFFGLREDMTVVELWPEGGWYSRILAPFLKDKGRLYLATDETTFGRDGAASRLRQEILGNRKVYGKPQFTLLAKGTYGIAPPGSADMVVTFRNVHNWMAEGYAGDVFKAAYHVLKPGGALGIEEHRAEAGPQDPRARSGYVTEAFVVGLARAAGFRLVASSEVNANPRDGRNYPKGVWTLPPTYAEGDMDRSRYEEIGESDRMTLKFVKPVR
jgi:predicted methyltransferase